MLEEEAKWISAQIKSVGFNRIDKILNIGSSTLAFRQRVQPYIDRDIFQPLRESNIDVIHMDLKKDEGVDINGNLLNADFQVELSALHVQGVLCSNVLEHVPDPRPFCEAIVRILDVGGVIIVTVPFRYPYHKDPIDTLFRPTVSELCALFPNTRLLLGEYVEASESMLRDMVAHKKFGILSLLRMIRFYDKEWPFYIGYAGKILKKYSATCVVLEKIEA